LESAVDGVAVLDFEAVTTRERLAWLERYEHATANIPFVWKGDNLIDTRTGQVVFSPSGP
jgi:hypothetical protein